MSEPPHRETDRGELPPDVSQSHDSLGSPALVMGLAAVAFASVGIWGMASDNGLSQCYYHGIFAGIVAMVMFFVGRLRSSDGRRSGSSRVRATAGCVLGCLPLLLYVGFGIVFAVAMMTPPPNSRPYGEPPDVPPDPDTPPFMTKMLPTSVFVAGSGRSKHMFNLDENGKGWYAVTPGGGVRVYAARVTDPERNAARLTLKQVHPKPASDEASHNVLLKMTWHDRAAFDVDFSGLPDSGTREPTVLTFTQDNTEGYRFLRDAIVTIQARHGSTDDSEEKNHAKTK